MTEAFNIFRRSKGKAGTADKVKAAMTISVTYPLHISKTNKPSVGYVKGNNWKLKISPTGVPTIEGKW